MFRFNAHRFRAERVKLGKDFAKPRTFPNVAYVPLIDADGDLYISLLDGTVQRLDRVTLAPVWSSQLQGPILSSIPFQGFLVLAHDALFVNDHGVLARFNRDTGQAEKLATIAELDLRDSVPALDGFVLQHYRGKQCSVGFFHGPDWAKPVWFFDTNCPGYRVSASGGVCYYSPRREEVAAVDIASGRPLWTFRADAPGDNELSGELLVLGDRVVGGFRERTVIALSASDGSVVWQVPVPAKTPSNLAAGPDGTLHLLNSPHYVRLDAATGAILKQVDLSEALQAEAISMVGQLEITDSYLFAADLYGKLFALDLETFELTVLVKRPGQVPFTHYPVAETGRLWFLDGKNHLLAFPARK